MDPLTEEKLGFLVNNYNLGQDIGNNKLEEYVESLALEMRIVQRCFNLLQTLLTHDLNNFAFV